MKKKLTINIAAIIAIGALPASVLANEHVSMRDIKVARIALEKFNINLNRLSDEELAEIFKNDIRKYIGAEDALKKFQQGNKKSMPHQDYEDGDDIP